MEVVTGGEGRREGELRERKGEEESEESGNEGRSDGWRW